MLIPFRVVSLGFLFCLTNSFKPKQSLFAFIKDKKISKSIKKFEFAWKNTETTNIFLGIKLSFQSIVKKFLNVIFCFWATGYIRLLVHITRRKEGRLDGRMDGQTQLQLTRYLSEEMLTRMRSSPTLTFSPSERCFEAGWIVHQHASPTHTHTQETNQKNC